VAAGALVPALRPQFKSYNFKSYNNGEARYGNLTDHLLAVPPLESILPSVLFCDYTGKEVV
jgi:hypothetical protein